MLIMFRWFPDLSYLLGLFNRSFIWFIFGYWGQSSIYRSCLGLGSQPWSIQNSPVSLLTAATTRLSVLCGSCAGSCSKLRGNKTPGWEAGGFRSTEACHRDLYDSCVPHPAMCTHPRSWLQRREFGRRIPAAPMTRQCQKRVHSNEAPRLIVPLHMWGLNKDTSIAASSYVMCQFVGALFVKQWFHYGSITVPLLSITAITVCYGLLWPYYVSLHPITVLLWSANMSADISADVSAEYLQMHLQIDLQTYLQI